MTLVLEHLKKAKIYIKKLMINYIICRLDINIRLVTNNNADDLDLIR